MSVANRNAIGARIRLIESRARVLAEEAVGTGEKWVKGLGASPTEAQAQEKWLEEVAIVAAYRELYRITSDAPVGRGANSDAQKSDRERALHAVRRARTAAGEQPACGATTRRSPAISGP
jgi:hypothetical protein